MVQVVLGGLMGVALMLLLYLRYRSWLMRRLKHQQTQAVVESLQRMDEPSLRKLLGNVSAMLDKFAHRSCRIPHHILGCRTCQSKAVFAVA